MFSDAVKHNAAAEHANGHIGDTLQHAESMHAPRRFTKHNFSSCFHGPETHFRIPRHEMLFISILRGLFAEGLIPDGEMIDAGANDGQTTCILASLAPTRRIYAIDPLLSNVKHIQQTYAAWPNIKPLVGVLGNQTGRMHMMGLDPRMGGQVVLNQKGTVQPSRSAEHQIQVLTTDDMFIDRPMGQNGSTLGFAHWDVEGFELKVLEGSRATLLRDRPIFSAELHVHQDIKFSRQLLQFTASLGYTSWLVEEICGLFADCRNLLFLPKERLATHFAGSPTLDLAMMSGAMVQTDAKNIGSLAFPCCQPGGACCPSTGPRTTSTTSISGCCNHRDALKWAKSFITTSAVRLQDGTVANFNAHQATDRGGRERWPTHPIHTVISP